MLIFCRIYIVEIPESPPPPVQVNATESTCDAADKTQCNVTDTVSQIAAQLTGNCCYMHTTRDLKGKKLKHPHFTSPDPTSPHCFT